MGYSKSLGTLYKIEPSLLMLKEGRACSWDVPPGDTADHFAYKIREALYIASRNASRFPELALARKNFSIQIVNDRLVQAVLVPGTAEGNGQTLASPYDSPVTQGLNTLAGPAVRDRAMVTSWQEVIDAWTAAQPTNDKILFPEALLSDEDLRKLAAWAAQLTPAWMLLRPRGSNALTLAPDDPNVPDAAKVKP